MGPMRLLSILSAIGLTLGMAGQRAIADEGTPERDLHDRAPTRQPRRRLLRQRAMAAREPETRSPCGRYVFEVRGGQIFVDGRLVAGAHGPVRLLHPPSWRQDGAAVAWLERKGSETRLVVVPDVETHTDPISWVVPHAV